ncbi:inhibitor of growth protein 2-like isoform X3 [Gigaspora margarita]|uniref:Chromatin modification-related protein n=1 Tax=Gigaspora margarita TaxID=4874 RepID=A0A8H4A2M6_GIGMA|nr:inhibitor of growth protein 2-like isoform X3 [Gigaspora margarita]
MEPIDANEYLIQYLGSIDNLPSEIHYHFTELTNKDQEIEQLAERIERRKKRLWCLYDGVPLEEDSDCSVMESVYEDQDTEDDDSDSEVEDRNEDEQTDDHIVKKKRRRVSRVITEFEDEEMLKDKIIKDYVRASQLQDEKIEIADKALALVERHIKRLDEDFDSLFPQHNLRENLQESSTSAPPSPSRLESLATSQPTSHHVNASSTQTTRTPVHQQITAVTPMPTSTFPNTGFDYNKFYYPSSSAESEEIPLPFLPNPTNSSAARCNKDSMISGRRPTAVPVGGNSARRRKQISQNNIPYISNSDASLNSHLSRGIKVRLQNGEESLSSGTSSVTDQITNGDIDLNILDPNADTYENTLMAGTNAFTSGFVQTVDPNEPVYCICRQVSFGEMIGCDGENCPIEWYHLECVGLKAVPEGRWFCDTCIGNVNQMKKRKRGRPAGS